MRKLWEDRHRWLLYFWLAMIVPVLIWRESVLLVLLMSWYANVEVSAAAHEAKRKR